MSRLPQDDARRLISEDKVCKILRKSFLSTPAQAPVGALRVGLEHSLVAQLSVFTVSLSSPGLHLLDLACGLVFSKKMAQPSGMKQNAKQK